MNCTLTHLRYKEVAKTELPVTPEGDVDWLRAGFKPARVKTSYFCRKCKSVFSEWPKAKKHTKAEITEHLNCSV